ncbi:cytochrome P450 9e2-like isoform X1 [Anticarsia gemmatalis]|uniref:cytochrome P450 9e2-like isoform X1 n=2 Tax=Anticarsia gemmatalis TaxID=129554 RepID=UPI003F758615
MQIMIVLLLWVSVLVIAVWLYLRQTYSVFEKYGVKHFKPLPFIGNMGKVLFRQRNVGIDIKDTYEAFPEEKFIGRYEFTNKTVMIRDLELVKKIGVKDYEYFLDRRPVFLETDSSFNRSLLSLMGQEWKDMRSTLSPAFTSSKIRLMVPFMVEVGEQTMASLKKKIKSSDAGYIDIDCKDLTSRYANDVIATCAFGLKVDSLTDEDNEFFTMVKETTTLGFKDMIQFFIMLNMPFIGKLLKIDFMSTATKKFFRSLVLDTMTDRERRQILRPDMIHLLMEAKKGRLSHENLKSKGESAGFASVEESSVGTKKVKRVWSNNDIIAQVVSFLFAGFETISTASSLLLYELALNPEVQDKLVEEIREYDIKNGGKLDLKSLQEMRYMDMVVSEVLRMWPPAMFTDRSCTKDYNLGKPNDKNPQDYIMRKGDSVLIPVFAFHRDPQYFPNPDKFDPERFSEQNKHKINPFAYMPFGVGPRNCIGSRFALCEVKVMIYQILQHLEVSPCERTCIPAELTTGSITVQLKGGHWLRFKARS